MVEYAVANSVEGDNYIGIPNPFVLALGKIVIIAGNLEGVGHEIIEALGVGDARPEVSFNKLMRRVQGRLVKASLPNCAQGNHDQLKAEIHQWCDAAIVAMDSRHPVMHAHYYFRANNQSQWVATREHLRPGTEYSIGLTELDAVMTSLETVTQWGRRLHHPLLHRMTEGGAGNHYVQRGVSESDQHIFVAARANYPACPYS